MEYGITYGGYNKTGLFGRSRLSTEELRRTWNNLTRWQKLTADVWPVKAKTAKGRRLHRLMGLSFDMC